jgi:hypothetical protein
MPRLRNDEAWPDGLPAMFAFHAVPKRIVVGDAAASQDDLLRVESFFKFLIYMGSPQRMLATAWSHNLGTCAASMTWAISFKLTGMAVSVQ